MKLLSINTAFPACDVAVLEHGRVLAHRREPMTRGQDARLAGICDELLNEARIGMPALDRIAVVTGPGSFTGVRVGVAFARGLALALNIPCIGVTSLEAAMPPGFRGPTLGALPAQVRPPELTYWTQKFDLGTAIQPPVELGLDDLVGDLNQQPIPLFGYGLEAITSEATDVVITPAEPSAITSGNAAIDMKPAAHPPVPVYARSPDAQPMNPHQSK